MLTIQAPFQKIKYWMAATQNLASSSAVPKLVKSEDQSSTKITGIIQRTIKENGLPFIVKDGEMLSWLLLRQENPMFTN